MKAIAIAFTLLLAACGTTIEGERLSQAAGKTDVSFEGCLPQDAGPCMPVKLKWTDGKAKASVKAVAYNPITGEKIFEYESLDVTLPVEVMKLLAEVKAQIAALQTTLGSDALNALSPAIVVP